MSESKALVPFGNVAPQSLWASFDVTTTEGKVRALEAMQGTDTVPIDGVLDQVLYVTDIFAHRVQMANQETGEMVDADRIVLFGQDGTAYACVSAGVARSLQAICGLFGAPPWHPAMALRVSRKRTRQGRTTYVVMPVIESA